MTRIQRIILPGVALTLMFVGCSKKQAEPEVKAPAEAEAPEEDKPETPQEPVSTASEDDDGS